MGISELARLLGEDCTKFSALGIRPVPPGCDEGCFLVFMGLMAAGSGDVEFLPTFNSGSVEFARNLVVRWSIEAIPTVHTYAGRKYINLQPVADYFMMDALALQRCYKQALARVYVDASVLTTLADSLLFCLPGYGFDDDLMQSLSAGSIVDYYCAHPAAHPGGIVWRGMSYKKLHEIATIIWRHGPELKYIESVALLSFEMTPAVLFAAFSSQFGTRK
jgi:hypothetical protein